MKNDVVVPGSAVRTFGGRNGGFELAESGRQAHSVTLDQSRQVDHQQAPGFPSLRCVHQHDGGDAIASRVAVGLVNSIGQPGGKGFAVLHLNSPGIDRSGHDHIRLTRSVIRQSLTTDQPGELTFGMFPGGHATPARWNESCAAARSLPGLYSDPCTGSCVFSDISNLNTHQANDRHDLYPTLAPRAHRRTVGFLVFVDDGD